MSGSINSCSVIMKHNFSWLDGSGKRFRINQFGTLWARLITVKLGIGLNLITRAMIELVHADCQLRNVNKGTKPINNILILSMGTQRNPKS